MIVINMIEIVDGVPKLIEYGRFEDGEITGKISIKDITREEVIDKFNRGYYRTNEV